MAKAYKLFRSTLSITFFTSIIFCAVVEIAVGYPPAKTQVGLLADLERLLISWQRGQSAGLRTWGNKQELPGLYLIVETQPRDLLARYGIAILWSS
jgi:hypothetical protein